MSRNRKRQNVNNNNHVGNTKNKSAPFNSMCPSCQFSSPDAFHVAKQSRKPHNIVNYQVSRTPGSITVSPPSESYEIEEIVSDDSLDEEIML